MSIFKTTANVLKCVTCTQAIVDMTKEQRAPHLLFPFSTAYI